MSVENPVLPSYLLNIPNPAETLQKSLQAGLQIGQAQQTAQAAQDAHAAALQEQQVKQQQIQAADVAAQQAQVQRDRVVAFRLDHAKALQDPSPGALSGLIQKYPDMIEAINSTGKALGAEEIKQMTPIYSAMVNKAPEVVASETGKLIEAYQNSKDPQSQVKVQQLQNFLKGYQHNPANATLAMTYRFAGDMGPEKLSENLAKLQETAQKVQESPYDLRSKIAAATTAEAGADLAKPKGLQEIATSKAAEASSTAQVTHLAAEDALAVKKDTRDQAAADRLANSLQPEAAKEYQEQFKQLRPLKQQAADAEALARGFADTKMLAGAPGKIVERFKSFMGDQDNVTQLRQQGADLSNKILLASIQGSGLSRVTGPEIELVKGPIPEMTSDPKHIAAYFTARKNVAKALAEDTELNLDWIGANKAPGPATRPLVFRGKVYNPGDPPPTVSAPVSAQVGTPPPSAVPARKPIDATHADLLRRAALHGQTPSVPVVNNG